MSEYYLKYAQGLAKYIATQVSEDEFTDIQDLESLKLDRHGLTNPNLHRRIDVEGFESPSVAPTQIQFGTYNLNSYRFKNVITHDEESTTSEIP